MTATNHIPTQHEIESAQYMVEHYQEDFDKDVAKIAASLRDLADRIDNRRFWNTGRSDDVNTSTAHGIVDLLMQDSTDREALRLFDAAAQAMQARAQLEQLEARRLAAPLQAVADADAAAEAEREAKRAEYQTAEAKRQEKRAKACTISVYRNGSYHGSTCDKPGRFEVTYTDRAYGTNPETKTAKVCGTHLNSKFKTAGAWDRNVIKVVDTKDNSVVWDPQA